MHHRLHIYIPALVGILAGLLSTTHILAGRWENLIFWGVVGVIIGWFVRGKKNVMWSGGVYGVFLILSFMIGGFNGASDKIGGLLILTAVLCVMGAVSGIVCVYAGSRLRTSRE